MSDDILRMLKDNDKRLRDTAVKEVMPQNYGATKPSVWPNNVPFFDTTNKLWVYFDGTRWLTVDEYLCIVGFSDSAAVTIAGATGNVRLGQVRKDYQLFFTRLEGLITTGAVNNGTNYFTYTLKSNAANIIVFDSSTSGINATVDVSAASGSFTQPTAAIRWVQLDMAIGAGAPSAHTPRVFNFWYRLIIP